METYSSNEDDEAVRRYTAEDALNRLVENSIVTHILSSVPKYSGTEPLSVFVRSFNTILNSLQASETLAFRILPVVLDGKVKRIYENLTEDELAHARDYQSLLDLLQQKMSSSSSKHAARTQLVFKIENNETIPALGNRVMKGVAFAYPEMSEENQHLIAQSLFINALPGSLRRSLLDHEYETFENLVDKAESKQLIYRLTKDDSNDKKISDKLDVLTTAVTKMVVNKTEIPIDTVNFVSNAPPFYPQDVSFGSYQPQSSGLCQPQYPPPILPALSFPPEFNNSPLHFHPPRFNQQFNDYSPHNTSWDEQDPYFNYPNLRSDCNPSFNSPPYQPQFEPPSYTDSNQFEDNTQDDFHPSNQFDDDSPDDAATHSSSGSGRRYVQFVNTITLALTIMALFLPGTNALLTSVNEVPHEPFYIHELATCSARLFRTPPASYSSRKQRDRETPHDPISLVRRPALTSIDETDVKLPTPSLLGNLEKEFGEHGKPVVDSKTEKVDSWMEDASNAMSNETAKLAVLDDQSETKLVSFIDYWQNKPLFSLHASRFSCSALSSLAIVAHRASVLQNEIELQRTTNRAVPVQILNPTAGTIKLYAKKRIAMAAVILDETLKCVRCDVSDRPKRRNCNVHVPLETRIKDLCDPNPPSISFESEDSYGTPDWSQPLLNNGQKHRMLKIMHSHWIHAVHADNTAADCIVDLKCDLEVIKQNGLDTIEIELAAEKRKTIYDEKHNTRPSNIKVGDNVLFRLENTNKFMPRFSGPFVVLEVNAPCVVLDTTDGPYKVHLDKVKIFHSALSMPTTTNQTVPSRPNTKASTTTTTANPPSLLFTTTVPLSAATPLPPLPRLDPNRMMTRAMRRQHGMDLP